RGHIRKWNGNKDGIMEFVFVEASQVKAVVSCKSLATAVDKDYPKSLRGYGVSKIFLFAECCKTTAVVNLRKRATQAGYQGMWFLYQTDDQSADKSIGVVKDENEYFSFATAIKKAVGNK
ncbi:MAG: hypothetical protein ABL962_17495, partial [Fimbriimonadaceae bacterium]